jgi:glycosyltransferase involved in cell wall biosynthesis
MNPKVSICIPTFGQAAKFKVLLQSIANQSFRDFEVIVTDDSPNDEIEQLCRNNQSFQIRYYKNLEVKGSPDNWNLAISYATGEWVKLIHHDDYFYSDDSLRNFVQATEMDPDVDYFFSATNIFDLKTGKQYPYEVPLNQLQNIDKYPAYLFPRNIIGAPSTGFFRKSMGIEYDKSLIWLVDVEYYSRIINKYKIKYIPNLLITTVISSEQLSTGLKNKKDVEIRELLYCYIKLKGTFNAFNMRIMRHRLIEIFQMFDVCSLKELESLRLISSIPFFAKLLIISVNVNKRLAYRLFFKFNQFNLF